MGTKTAILCTTLAMRNGSRTKNSQAPALRNRSSIVLHERAGGIGFVNYVFLRMYSTAPQHLRCSSRFLLQSEIPQLLFKRGRTIGSPEQGLRLPLVYCVPNSTQGFEHALEVRRNAEKESVISSRKMLAVWLESRGAQRFDKRRSPATNPYKRWE
jgi:hypothetical protein